ncbi:hypothetical protein [Peribacillus asahii]|uniref:hypothetical protein n=1 Tax=Peribacillus asahii TaxID=228899 RepID=UPI0015F93663|nr:hypothetical protein [Peribacillus asahii]
MKEESLFLLLLGIRLATYKKPNNSEEIAEAIEKVYNVVNDDYKKLVRLKYRTKPQTKM